MASSQLPPCPTVGTVLASQPLSELPPGEEDLGEAFDFEDSDEEEDEDSATEPSRGAVLQAPPRRHRATSYSTGEVPLFPKCLLWLARLMSSATNLISLCFLTLQRGWCRTPRKGMCGSGEKMRFWRSPPSLACPSLVLCLSFSISIASLLLIKGLGVWDLRLKHTRIWGVLQGDFRVPEVGFHTGT